MGPFGKDRRLLIADAKLGAVITLLDQIAAVTSRRRQRSSYGQPGLREEAASFRGLQIREDLDCLPIKKKIYERHIEAKLQSDDRENIKSVWHNLGEVVKRSKKVADRLLVEVKRDRTDKQEIEACTAELDSNATTLNTWVGNLNV